MMKKTLFSENQKLNSIVKTKDLEIESLNKKLERYKKKHGELEEDD